PAETAGIKAGDRVTLVDGKDAAELPDAVLGAALYGATGGIVRLKGQRRDGGALNGNLKREFGGMPTVWGFNIPGTRLGYLRIVAFSGKASGRIRSEVNDLLDSGAAELVIDLRHNYGGSLGELSNALALFAAGRGTVFKVVSRHPGYSKVFSAEEAGPFAGVKTLLLNDSGTVSRAEIFAATLREWRVASIFGEATAGNVALTRGFRLKDGGALRVTVAHILTPSGADLDEKGVAPDVPLNAQPPGGQAPIGEFPPAVASADPLLRRALGI
ncbi:MAG: S41 family peptidase, partial [Elusimicrobia bacterium]|nr:S41 family peptidase [Elusimicrobiota bacterium]